MGSPLREILLLREISQALLVATLQQLKANNSIEPIPIYVIKEEVYKIIQEFQAQMSNSHNSIVIVVHSSIASLCATLSSSHWIIDSEASLYMTG